MRTSCRLLWALVLVHATSGTALAKDVRVDVVFDRPLASQALAFQALKESAAVWGPYGVTVATPPARDCASDSAIRLGVSLGHGPEREMASASLGSIRFLDGVHNRRSSSIRRSCARNSIPRSD